MKESKALGILFLAVVLMFSAGTMLFAGGEGEEGAEETGSAKQVVNYWSRNGGPLGTVMETMVQEFNAANPDIEVKLQVMTWGGEYYSKVRSAIMVGEAPEIFDVSVYAPAMFLKYVESYTEDDLRQAGIDISEYAQSAWNALKFDGRYYGVPIGLFPIGLYWNKDMFAEAGLDPNAPPTNASEFIEYGKALTKDTDGDGEIDQWGTIEVNWYNLVAWIWESFLVQNGGSLLNEDNSKAAFNTQAGIDALNLYVDFVRKYKISPLPGDAPEAFGTGKVGMIIDFAHGLAGFKSREGLNFGITRMPAFFSERPNMSWSSMNIFLSPKGLRKDAGKWNATMTFIGWIMGTDFQTRFAEGAGELPSKMDAFEALNSDPYLADVAAAIAEGLIFFPPSVVDATEIFTVMGDSMGQAFAGESSVEEVLAEAEKQVNQILAR